MTITENLWEQTETEPLPRLITPAPTTDPALTTPSPPPPPPAPKPPPPPPLPEPGKPWKY